MARRENTLFIGSEFMNIEGRSIKHPSLISEFGTININKVSSTPLEFVGMDLETDVETGDMKLLGFYLNNECLQYTDDFLSRLLQVIKWANRKERNLTYWNKLDPFQIFKLFLLQVNEYEQLNSLKRYGKTGGRWDRKLGEWVKDEPPVIEIELNGYYFGIQIVIRSSIKFFYRTPNTKTLRVVWAYDIAQLYQFGLEREALGLYDEKTKSYPNARLPYYSKVDESAHIIDWTKFETDDKYKKLVLHSNYLDARAVHDLANHLQNDFYKAFKWYPRTLISAGSIARAAIVALSLNKYNALIPNKKLGIPHTPEYEMAVKDIKSIPMITYYDTWLNNYGEDILKEILSASTEAYKGGYIEALEFGHVDTAYYADISSAYPSFIQKLYNLEGAKVTWGNGIPPNIKYSYCLIRGDVNIPKHINIHPLTIKHPTSLDTNIRAVGEYRATYLKEERDYLIELGATFKNEEWFNIETKGELSPLSDISTSLTNLRTYFLSIKDSAQSIAKDSNNSLYGILFEAVDNFIENTNSYRLKDVVNIIKGALDISGSPYYDLNMSNVDIEKLSLNVMDMLYDHEPLSDIIVLISNTIINNAFYIDDNYDFRFRLIKKYIKSINLIGVVNELKSHFDTDYLIHYNRFNDKRGDYPDSILNELENQGVFFIGTTYTDKLIDMFEVYHELKNKYIRKVKMNIKEHLNEKDFKFLVDSLVKFLYDSLKNISSSDIESGGYRAGEFFNPLYAAWVTSQTRIMLSRAANNIVDNGGNVLLLMTDSIFWTGAAENLSSTFYKETKTTGYFEKPQLIHNLLSLGSGRYEYYENGHYRSKRRGLNTTDWHSPDGLDRTNVFSWKEAISNPLYLTDEGKISVNVRTLISVGMVLHSNKRIEDGVIKGYDIYDLGKIIEQKREVDAIIGLTKRVLPSNIKPNDLVDKTVSTDPLRLDRYMFGKDMIVDQTLPKLRELMKEQSAITLKQRDRATSRRTSANYLERHRDRLYADYRDKYNRLRGIGFNREEARERAVWSYDRLKDEIEGFS